MHAIRSLDPSKTILTLALVFAAMALGATLLIGGNLASIALISGAFLGCGVIMVRQGGLARDAGLATALIGQAIALTAAFQGHPWQIDTHMLFFALLACLILLRSIPAILVATAITAVHHLSLSVLLPALVYPSADLIENLSRTAMHAVIVLMETAVLVVTVLIIRRLEGEMRAQNAEINETLLKSDAAREQAQAAQAAAEQANAEAKAAQLRAETLLNEAKTAEEQRSAAERQRTAEQTAFAQRAEAAAQEQARFVTIVRDSMERLQAGDLTTRIDGGLPETYQDVGRAFNQAVAALDSAFYQVATQSQEMEGQIAEIAAATADLAKRTEQQAYMLRDSSSGLEDLTRVVATTESSVKDMDGSAKTAQNSAQASEVVVAETSKAMQAIQSEAEEISKIVSVIDEIAFQTNLLALNAGVEAARAGDAGRGFAVVASEVRGLAQRSSDSATHIRELIARSGQQVQEGSTKIEQTVGSLGAVLSAVLEISSKTGKIAQGAQTQTAGISELNQKVAQLDTTTQQNAAMFEETSAACTSLKSSAHILGDLTKQFQVSQDQTGASAAA